MRAAIVMLLAGACERERHMPEPAAKMHARITQIGGSAPLEAQGTLSDGKAFYFRARGEEWSFAVGVTPDTAAEAPEWAWSEPYGDREYDASYLPESVARAIIESCAQMRANGVAPPAGFVGVPQGEASATRLAWMILRDVALYQKDADATALRAAVDEGRGLFRERVEPRYSSIYDQMFKHLDACRRGEAVHLPWLRDAASAHSVGLRWHAMLERLVGAERDELTKASARWFDSWAPDPTVRAAIRVR